MVKGDLKRKIIQYLLDNTQGSAQDIAQGIGKETNKINSDINTMKAYGTLKYDDRGFYCLDYSWKNEDKWWYNV